MTFCIPIFCSISSSLYRWIPEMASGKILSSICAYSLSTTFLFCLAISDCRKFKLLMMSQLFGLSAAAYCFSGALSVPPLQVAFDDSFIHSKGDYYFLLHFCITCKKCKIWRWSRDAFCKWFYQMCAREQHFPSLILYTYGLQGVINFYNMHYWSEKNPHAIIYSRHQQ